MIDKEDREQALERLTALEKEAEELRKVLEGKIEVNENKNYVFIDENGMPYIFAHDSGSGIGYNRFHSFERCMQGYSWSKPDIKTCFDYHEKAGKIYEFTGCIPAVEFFLEKRWEYESK